MSKHYSRLYVWLGAALGVTLLYADNQIPAVVVSPAKHTSKVISDSAKTTVSDTDIKVAGDTTLADTLRNLGPIQLQDTTGNGSQVMLSMRGFGVNASSNTLLLINGVPITNPDIAPPDLNAISLANIKNIEIISGSESVLYGDQAVGGIVNITTQDSGDKHYNFSCSTGSYHAYNCGVTARNHYRELNYLLSVDTNHTDNYRAHNIYNQHYLLGNMNYAYATGKLVFDYSLNNEMMQYPGALTGEQVSSNRRQASNETNYFTDNNYMLHLRDTQQLGLNWQLQTDISQRKMVGNGVLFSPFTQSRYSNFLKPVAKTTLGETTLLIGGDLQQDQYTLNSIFDLTQDRLQKAGLFTLATIPVTTQWIFTLGARGALQSSQLIAPSTFNSVNRAVATTAGVSSAITPIFSTYLRRAESFRFPKADENASTAPGIHGLQTQRGVSYETGLNWQAEQHQGQFGIYQLNLRDEITFNPLQTPNDPFGTNTNLDPTVRRGLTVSDKYTVSQQWRVDGQYNGVQAAFQNGPFNGNRIPLVVQNILRSGLNYQYNDFYHVYAEAVYTGNQYAANDNANITPKMGGYTIFNTNIGYDVKSIHLALHLNNMFNRYYYFYNVYEPSITSEFFYPAPGRNMTLTCDYNFA